LVDLVLSSGGRGVPFRSEPTGSITAAKRSRKEIIMLVAIIITIVIISVVVFVVKSDSAVEVELSEKFTTPTVSCIKPCIIINTPTDIDMSVPMPRLTAAIDKLCAFYDTVNVHTEVTVDISDLPVAEQVADAALTASCDTSDMSPVVVGSTPLNPNHFMTPVDTAVHAGDVWLTGKIAQVSGLAHTIDRIVEEYYDRVEWMIIMMKGGDR